MSILLFTTSNVDLDFDVTFLVYSILLSLWLLAVVSWRSCVCAYIEDAK